MDMKEQTVYPKVFQENPEFYTEFISRLEECVDNFIKIISSGIKPHIQSSHSLYNILDIGGGTGETIIKLLRAIRSVSNRSIRLDYLDSSQEMHTLFQQKIAEEGLQGVLNETFVEKWEDHKSKRKYDFVLSCESWFGIGNWEKSLTKLYDSLNQRGVSCLVIESEGNDFVKFKRRFLPELYGDEQVVYGKLICDVLDKLKIPYKRQTEITQRLDISDVLPDENGEISNKGKLFISYLVRKDYETLPSDVKQEIQDFLSSQYKDKIFVLENDFIWINKQ